MYYCLVRNERNDREVLGMITKPRPVTNSTMIVIINAAVGTTKWSFDYISQAEFETYREFGFKEIDIEVCLSGT